MNGEHMAQSREERKAAAQKHLSLMRGVFAAETKASIEATEIIEDGEAAKLALPEHRAEKTTIEVTGRFPAAALLRVKEGKTLLVDPASFTRPGGSYEEGGFGPEQALCADSNLYPILQGLKSAYHDKNRGYARGLLFTDRTAYVPEVTFNRDGVIRKADVLVISEPVLQKALENHRSEAECDKALASRIDSLLTIAAAKECDTLIVGAFGCGRQGYSQERVISLFNEWIESHEGLIPHIVFAVPRDCVDAFDEAFGQPKVETPEVVEPDEEGEEEELFDLSDLPEGVTFR